MKRRAALIVAVVAGLAGPARAERAEPEHLVLAGLGLALPTYAAALLAHEGSHALAAELGGGDVVEWRLLPGVNPRDGNFYFGYVRVTGLSGPVHRTWFLLAPKLTDLCLLGSYAALVLGDHMPGNDYGHLALTVLATGFWIDLSKDIPAFWRSSDVVKLYDLAGAKSELQRLPLRLVHAGVSAAAAYLIARDYAELFDRDADGAPLIVPLARSRF